MGGLGVAPGMKALLNFDNRQKAALEVAMEEKTGEERGRYRRGGETPRGGSL